jgi:hypothetical protein
MVQSKPQSVRRRAEGQRNQMRTIERAAAGRMVNVKITLDFLSISYTGRQHAQS